MTSHVAIDAVWSQGKVILDEAAYIRQLERMKLGEGEAIEVRITRPVEAKKHWQLKWYYGFIVKQCCAHTGYTTREMDAILRAACLPPDVATLSDTSYDAMREFILACEAYAAQTIGVSITGPDDVRQRAA